MFSAAKQGGTTSALSSSLAGKGFFFEIGFLFLL
jgi:hypothetical protein